MPPAVREDVVEILTAALADPSITVDLVDACRPATREEGYRLQAELVRRLGDRLVGWKVGATSAGAQALLDTPEPFSGCLVEGMVVPSPADFAGLKTRRLWVEAEYCFRFAAIPSPKPEWDEMVAAIRSVHLAIEVCETRFPSIAGIGIHAHVADNGLARFLVVGDEIAGWRAADLTERRVFMRVNGEEKAQGDGKAVLGDPLKSLHWVLLDRGVRGETVGDDFLITTGSCTGMVEVHPNDRAEAEFEGLGTVRLSL